MAALRQAIHHRQPQPGLVHHSDQGSQYASHDYVRELAKIGAIPSMSGPGRPWENARCESFLRTLKKEEIDARAYATLEELEQQIEEFIETVYNVVRLHSPLRYCSPVEFEQIEAPATPWHPAAMEFPARREVAAVGPEA